MKITTTKLRQVIKEELRFVLEQSAMSALADPAADKYRRDKRKKDADKKATDEPMVPPATVAAPEPEPQVTKFGPGTSGPPTKPPTKPQRKRRGWKRAGSVEEAAQDSSNKTHIRRGMRGSAVKQVQDILCEKGYDDMCQVVESGKGYGRFGPRTQAAVQQFQRDFSARLGTRGVVGYETGNCLLNPACPGQVAEPAAPEEPAEPVEPAEKEKERCPEVDPNLAAQYARRLQKAFGDPGEDRWGWGTKEDEVNNVLASIGDYPGMTQAVINIFKHVYGRHHEGGTLRSALEYEGRGWFTDDGGEAIKWLKMLEDNLVRDRERCGKTLEVKVDKGAPLPRRKVEFIEKIHYIINDEPWPNLGIESPEEKGTETSNVTTSLGEPAYLTPRDYTLPWSGRKE